MQSTIEQNLRILQQDIGDYVRLPQQVAKDIGVTQLGESQFGCEARLAAITEFLAPRKSNFAVDLGGNCGFFCLSLLQNKVIEQALVVDHEVKMTTFGNEVADFMDLAKNISFEKQSVSLDWLENMPDCDVVICQNLLHHAGSIFDLEKVEHSGWGEYASKFLTELRSKSKHAVIGINFEEGKPVNWLSKPEEKAEQFAELMNNAGWEVQRMGRVFDLVKERMSSGDSGAASATSGLLMNRGLRSFLTKISITGSRLLGSSWLGRLLRKGSVAKSFKKSLDETRSVRTDHYYYFFAD